RALAHTLPPGVRLTPVYDQASLVRDAVNAVPDAMLVGAALAVVVLLLFLRHGRITAVSASSIPLTLVITIFLMWLLGQTFNLMTLGAMAIAIGLVIDDAVVITENIVRHLALNPDRTAAIREAIQELLWPVTTSTLTTVVVFLPLGLLQGVVGQFFHALSITLTIAVLVSLGLACSVIRLQSQRHRSIDEVIDEVRGRATARLPRMRIEFVQILSDVVNDLAGSARPVELKLFGPDLAALEAYGTQLDSAMAGIAGLEDLFSGVSEPTAELAMHVDAAEANQVGLTPAAVSQSVSGALLGVDAGQVYRDDRSIGVR